MTTLHLCNPQAAPPAVGHRVLLQPWCWPLGPAAGRWPQGRGGLAPSPAPRFAVRAAGTLQTAGGGFPDRAVAWCRQSVLRWTARCTRFLPLLARRTAPAHPAVLSTLRTGTDASRGSVYSAGGSRSSWCGRPVAEHLLRVRGVCGSSHASSVPPVPPTPPAAVPALVPVGSFSPPCEDSRAGKPYGHICDHWAQAWEPRLMPWALGFPSDPPRGRLLAQRLGGLRGGGRWSKTLSRPWLVLEHTDPWLQNLGPSAIC